MAKARSKVVDYLVFLAVRIAVCIIQCLSLKASRSLAVGLAWVAYKVDKRHRRVAAENLWRAYPELGYDAVDQLVRDVYRHFLTVVIEIVQIPRKLCVTNWKKYIELAGGPEIVRALLSDRPLLIVTGHFGNWEMAGYTLGLLGFKTYAIARPLDNPYLNDYFLRFRQKTGQTIINKNGDFDRLVHVLQSGGVVATLADQDAGQRGLFVDFFGRPASTHKAVALLALEHQVPMAVSGAPRVGAAMKYLSVTEEVIFPEEYAKERDPVRALTQRFTAALERLIRRYPEQYFWLHRRWKHQPVAKAKKTKQAA